MICALIFDMDGLLVDTEPLWREAEVRQFGKVGLSITEDQCKETMGMRIEEAVQYWCQRAPWTLRTPQEVVTAIVQDMVELIQAKAAPLPGVMEAVAWGHAQGMPMAIASSSHEVLIRAVVDKWNLQDRIPVLCSAEKEAHGKPHPAVFLTAAEKLNTVPEQCLVFEDSVTGVIAARAANMRVVAVPDPVDRGLPQFSIAHAVWPSMTSFAQEAPLGFPGVMG